MVVVAASSGGVEPLRVLLGELPADLPAALFVVLHVTPDDSGALPGLLDRSGPLKVVPAEDRQPVEHGHVYVARPDHHLLVHDGMTRLSRGPLHNGHRPAADPLFMSAALDAGRRVAAVVLSGALDDGAKGSQAVDHHGGAVAVQDPQEAGFPGMPQAAVAAVANAIVLPVRELAGWIVRQSRTPVIAEEQVDDAGVAVELARFLGDEPTSEVPAGEFAGHSCPECGGPMYEQKSGTASRFVCRLGHAWTGDRMIDAQADAVERALWVTIQRLEDRLRLLDRMRHSAGDRGREIPARRFGEEAERTREALGTIRVLQSRIGRDPILRS